ncbi:MAG: hypothetical protein FJ304_24965 [Planctomycetes bacterium]|nr:hypothetical protein [Planctomycetota bacterium]
MNERRSVIHWTELPEDTGPLATVSAVYRREAGRLMIEGHDGRWVVIKGEEIVGIWDTRTEAFAVADKRYPLEPVFVKQILEWEPLVRLPMKWYLWRNSPSQS